jgi:hypothetical protein
MISFIAKTWWLWWMLATVVAVRWFHLLSEANQMEPAETLAPEVVCAQRQLHLLQSRSLALPPSCKQYCTERCLAGPRLSLKRVPTV